MSGDGSNTIIITDDVDLAAEFGVKVAVRNPTNNHTNSLGHNVNYQELNN